MNTNKVNRFFSVLLCCLIVCPVYLLNAQTDKAAKEPKVLPNTMKKTFHAFKQLQEYLHNKEAFDKAENEREITRQLSELQTNFHSLDNSDTGYEKDLSFRASLEMAEEVIDSSLKQFKEGNKEWVLWRLRTLSNHCYSCHATHGIDVAFHDASTEEQLPDNPDIRAEYYLASRQFERASKEFLQAAINAPETSDRLDPLRKWLFITVRVDSNPRIAMQELKQVIESVDLTTFEVKIIKAWLTSLRDWKKEGSAGRISVEAAEQLINQSTSLHDPAFSAKGSVELLRATGILHRVLERDTLSPEDHRKALYLLGLSYSKIPQFFINELPEVYLEQVIRTYPGTDEAKQSYELYEDIVLEGFTGSSGTHVPLDVQKKLDLLKKLAHSSAHRTQ